MELTHTGDDRLSGVFVSISLKGRVFFRQLSQRDTHLFLTGFRLRLDGDFDYRIREFHGLQDDLVLFVTESITCSRILQAYCRSDIAGVDLADFFSLVGVHLQDSSDSALLALR